MQRVTHLVVAMLIVPMLLFFLAVVLVPINLFPDKGIVGLFANLGARIPALFASWAFLVIGKRSLMTGLGRADIYGHTLADIIYPKLFRRRKSFKQLER